MLQSTNSPCQPEQGACLEFEIARKKNGVRQKMPEGAPAR
jgi:hypothetical protein